jgi:hypothetical protein
LAWVTAVEKVPVSGVELDQREGAVRALAVERDGDQVPAHDREVVAPVAVEVSGDDFEVVRCADQRSEGGVVVAPVLRPDVERFARRPGLQGLGVGGFTAARGVQAEREEGAEEGRARAALVCLHEVKTRAHRGCDRE